MIIAIDYDQAYTLDTAENRSDVKAGEMAVWFTGLAPKKWFMENRGIKVDVWIDDDPACVINGK